MFNAYIDRLFRADSRLALLMTTVSVTMLFSILDQTGWAAVIYCSATTTVCYGTSVVALLLRKKFHEQKLNTS